MMPTLAVELDVVEALLLGGHLQRVLLRAAPRTRRARRAGSRRCRPATPCRPAPRAGRRPSLTSGLTSTSVASSLMKTSHSFTIVSLAWSATSAGKPVAATISAALASSTPTSGSMDDLGDRVGVLDRDHLDLHAALDGGDAQVVAVGPGRPGTRSSTPRRCRRPGRPAPGAPCGP